MPTFTVERSIHIEASAEHVHGFLRDFRRWPEWSPWLIAEPACEVTYAEDGDSYRWDGEIVGSGEMALTGEDGHAALDYRLTFLSPWKSQNTAAFRLVEENGGTTVTWNMVGSLPWFMFWMKKMMSAWVGQDYERGLRMLKDLAEIGSVPSTLTFPGVEDHQGSAYIAVERTCSMAEMGDAMKADFGRLQALLEERSLTPSGHFFSIYHKWEMVTRRVSYTACVPLSDVPRVLPDGITSGEYPAGRSYEVHHTGAYRHLGNAWSAGLMHERAKQFAKHGKLHPREVYVSMPDVEEAQALTLVCFPAKQ